MFIDWNDEALAQGLACYRNGEFFLAHEHWEGVWLKCSEPEKTFLQSLIQIAAAFHHLQRGNTAGTRSLLSRALGRLDSFPNEFCGVAVEALRESVRGWLNALHGVNEGADEPQMPLPKIR